MNEFSALTMILDVIKYTKYNFVFKIWNVLLLFSSNKDICELKCFILFSQHDLYLINTADGLLIYSLRFILIFPEGHRFYPLFHLEKNKLLFAISWKNEIEVI